MHWFTVPLTLQWHSHLPCTGPQHRHFALHRERALANWQQGDGWNRPDAKLWLPSGVKQGVQGCPPLWRALQWNSPPLVPVLPLSPLLLPHLFTPDWKWLSINDNPVDPSWLREDKIFYLILHSLCCPGWKWHQILITKAKKLWKANKVFIDTSPPYSALNANINWFPKLDRSRGKFSRYFTDCGFVLLGNHRPSNADLAENPATSSLQS